MTKRMRMSGVDSEVSPEILATGDVCSDMSLLNMFLVPRYAGAQHSDAG